MADDSVRVLSEHVLSDEWARLTRYTVERKFRDGTRRKEVRQVYNRGNAAAVLPIDRTRGTVLLVRQFRIPVWLNPATPGEANGMLIEACAGLNEGNDPETAVRKEALEELGYRLGAVEQVADIHMSPGSVAERLALFVAAYTPGGRVSDGGGLKSEGEDIEVIEMPLSEAFDMVVRGEITDAKTVILLQRVQIAGIVADAQRRDF